MFNVTSGFFPSILSDREVLIILAGCHEVERPSNNYKAASFLKFILQASVRFNFAKRTEPLLKEFPWVE